MEIEKMNGEHVVEVPQKLKERSISTLAEYFGAIKDLSRNDGITWFRGQSKRTYKLQPGLFRHPDIEHSQTPHIRSKELESKLMERFKNQSVPYVGDKFSHEEDWGLLFFMQHYRIPTRLLDWSYSPLVALYFALSTVDREALDSCGGCPGFCVNGG